MSSLSPTRPTIPTAIAEVFRPLHNELLDIHAKWSLYRQLFATDPDRIDLLNHFAPIFFFYVERTFYDDFVLALSRIMDPAATGRMMNLSLDRLAIAVTSGDPAFGALVQVDASAIRAIMAPHADWRNKRVAHNDLAGRQAAWSGTSNLQGPSRVLVEELLERMGALMNRVATNYGESPTAYDALFWGAPGDADSLVRHLERLSSLGGKPTP